ncbi:MAG: hypothetical protein LBF93_12215 [Zoogloeaceae bacterium]|jgi:hypothetical protein|nr:hypothetical protein [Zoogloeaceae bacterium]
MPTLTIPNPTLAGLRAAAGNLHGNLKISENTEQTRITITRAGRFAWIRSVFNIGGAQQANQRTLDALKSAYHLADVDGDGAIAALLGRARTDRPLSGARIRKLLERADAPAKTAANARIENICTNRGECGERLIAQIQERAQQNPALETLLNHPETRRLNDGDFGKLMAYTRAQMARQEVRDMPPEERIAYCENMREDAINGLLDRRLAVLSANGLEADQQNRLLENLMDDQGAFADIGEQLTAARRISAQNAQVQRSNQELAESLSTQVALRKVIEMVLPEVLAADIRTYADTHSLPLSDALEMLDTVDASARKTLEELDNLPLDEGTALQQAFRQKICLGTLAMGERPARELSREEAVRAQWAFAEEICRALTGEAWEKVAAIKQEYPLEADYFREKILRGEKIPATMIEELPRLAAAMSRVNILAQIGEAGKSSPGALYQALLDSKLPDVAHKQLETQQQGFIESLADILVARQEEARPESARELSARLLKSGTSRALRTFVSYWAQNGGDTRAMTAFSLAYECVARATARRAGMADADFDLLWERVPKADSRAELPADTQAGARIEGSAAARLPHAPDPDALENLKADIIGPDVFGNPMRQAMQRDIRNPAAFVNSQFYKDIDRGQETWLDGARVPTGGELPASSPAARAERFYLPLLRFINPGATLATASRQEIAQMHVLASLFHQGLYGSVMMRGDQSLNAGLGGISPQGENFLFGAPMQGGRNIAVSLDHAGDDLLLRVDYGQACNTLTKLGDAPTDLAPASRHSATAAFTLPRAELERLGEKWVNLTPDDLERLGQTWADNPDNARNYAFNIRDARLEARATLNLNLNRNPDA